MKKVRLYFIVIITLVLQSCYSYYVPNENSTPMLSKEKQVILNGSAGIGFNYQNYSGSIAYAPKKNLGLVYQRSSFENGTKNILINKGHYNEFSIGHFHFIDENLLFETYINYGFGRTDNFITSWYQFTSGYDKYNIKYNRGSINIAIGSVHKNYCLGIYTRLGSMDFYDVNYNNIRTTELLTDLNNINRKRHFIFCEPGFTGKVGFDNFKFYIKGSYSIIDQNFSSIEFVNRQITMGLQIELNKKTNK